MWWGWVSGIEAEWGDFSIDDLELSGFEIERDRDFKPLKMKDVKLYRERMGR